MPAKVFISEIIHASVDDIWALVRDFCPMWHPDVAACHIENNEDYAKVGCVRNFTLHDGGVIREKLLSLSDIDYSYVYSIEESGLALSNYVAALKLFPVTENANTYAQWTAEFDCSPEQQAEMQEIIFDVFKRGFDALNAHFSG